MDSIMRRFVVKDEEKIEVLQELISKKNLSKEDLLLILTTISVNPE